MEGEQESPLSAASRKATDEAELSARAEAVDRGAGVSLLRLRGVIDAATAFVFHDFLGKQAAGERPRAILDFSEVTYVNSTGWGTLVAYTARFRERGGELRVSGVHGMVAQSYHLLALDSYVRTYEDWKQARDERWEAAPG